MTELWFVDGSDHIGTVVIRHRLTPALERQGGHIGYHVVPAVGAVGMPPRCSPRPGRFCRRLGLSELLVTCAETNRASRRVIEANGGALDRIADGEARYRVPTSQPA